MDEPKKCKTCTRVLSAYEIRKRCRNCQSCARRLSGSLQRYDTSVKGVANQRRYGTSAKGRVTKRWYNRSIHGAAASAVHRRGCDRKTFHRCRTSRCVICNVPPWLLQRYGLGPMQVGHLVPGDASGGFEPMCKKCNTRLGARALTETTGRSVLKRVRYFWINRMLMRDALWIHTDVDSRGYGIGGINETPGRQAKLDSFTEAHEGKQRTRAGGRTDPHHDDVSAQSPDGSVVLEGTARSGNPED